MVARMTQIKSGSGYLLGFIAMCIVLISLDRINGVHLDLTKRSYLPAGIQYYIPPLFDIQFIDMINMEYLYCSTGFAG